MPEMREVFEMTTKQIEPDVDAWREQEQHQRRSFRNRRIGAILVAAGLSVAAIVAVVLVNRSDGGTTPAGVPSTRTPTDDTTEPQRQILPTADPAFDDSYVITLKLVDGYEFAPGDDVIFGSDGGQGISAWTVGNVYAKPCHSDGMLLDPPIRGSVEALAAALAGQHGRHATKPTDVEVDGYPGKYMEMTVPAGINVAECDHGEYRTWTDTFGENRTLEAGQRDLLWIIDVDGNRLVIDAALGPQTTEQERADRIQMVESIQIDPV